MLPPDSKACFARPPRRSLWKFGFAHRISRPNIRYEHAKGLALRLAARRPVARELGAPDMSAPAIEVPEAVGVEEVTTYVPPEEARKKATSKKRWAGASVIVAALSVAFFITAVLFVDMPVIAAGTFLACLFPALILSLHLLLEGLPLGLDDLLDAVAATGGESDASCGPDLISHHWMRVPGSDRRAGTKGGARDAAWQS